MSSSQRKISFLPDSILNAVIQDADISELLKILRNKRGKVNINQQNHVGLTALHQAVLSNNLDAVKMLLTHGSDVNAQDVNGFSPLHTASACGYMQISSLLVVYGADVLLLNKQAEYPIDVAKDLNIVRLLSEEMYSRLHSELYIHSLFLSKLCQLWKVILRWIKLLLMTFIDIFSNIFRKNNSHVSDNRNSISCDLIKDTFTALEAKNGKASGDSVENKNRSNPDINLEISSRKSELKQNKDKCD